MVIDEEEEELAEEARDEEVIKALEDIYKRYKALFGNDPDGRLTLAEIQERIVAEMTRRDLRPFRL